MFVGGRGMYAQLHTPFVGKDNRRYPYAADAALSSRICSKSWDNIRGNFAGGMLPEEPSGVIFEDNFDDSPNWQSLQTVHKSMPGGDDKGWPNIWKDYTGTIKYNPPQNWTSFRCASSHWKDDRRRDTYLLNSEGARGGSGKGITYNIYYARL